MATDPPTQAPGGPSTTARGPISGGAGESPLSAAGVVLDDLAIRRALTRIGHELVERVEDLDALYLVGIPNGGVPLARQIARPPGAVCMKSK